VEQVAVLQGQPLGRGEVVQHVVPQPRSATGTLTEHLLQVPQPGPDGLGATAQEIIQRVAHPLLEDVVGLPDDLARRRQRTLLSDPGVRCRSVLTASPPSTAHSAPTPRPASNAMSVGGRTRSGVTGGAAMPRRASRLARSRTGRRETAMANPPSATMEKTSARTTPTTVSTQSTHVRGSGANIPPAVEAATHKVVLMAHCAPP
jgi:hypothetical protein